MLRLRCFAPEQQYILHIHMLGPDLLVMLSVSALSPSLPSQQWQLCKHGVVARSKLSGRLLLFHNKSALLPES